MKDPLEQFRTVLGRVGRELQASTEDVLRPALEASQQQLRDLGNAIREHERRLEDLAAATFGYPEAFHDLLVVITADDRKRETREYGEALSRLRGATRQRSQLYKSLNPFLRAESTEAWFTQGWNIPPIPLADHRWSIAVFLAAAEVGPKSSPAWAIREVLRRALNHSDSRLRQMGVLIPRTDTAPLPEDEAVPLNPALVVDQAEPKGDIRRYFWPPPTAAEGRVLDALEETWGDREAARELTGMSASTFRVHLHNLRKKRISGI